MPINTTNTWLSTYLGLNPTLWYRQTNPNYTALHSVSQVTSSQTAQQGHLAQAQSGFAKLYPMICRHNHSDILTILTLVR
ncbi:hypothetical protein ACVWZM_003154 [Bradyrhizobium sp. USDA 4501]